jgi:hypothetical protein
VREWRTKFGLLRLDSGLERGTCTEERKETWRQNARKGGENARKEERKVVIADEGREEREGARGSGIGEGTKKAASSEGRGQRIGKGLGSVAVQFAVRTYSPFREI